MNKDELLKEAIEHANVSDESAETCEDTEAIENRDAEVKEEKKDIKEKATKKDDVKVEEKVVEMKTEKKTSSKKTSKKKVDKSKEKIDELENKLKRQLAEFENFRKRTEVEKAARFNMGAKSVLEKILPVVDNFERGLSTVSEDGEDGSFVDGMSMIYKQLLTELETIGVEAIPTVGEEFDPELHNAVMQVESDEYESGIVAQEMLKGYTYKGDVVRHSMVAVVS